MIEIENKEKYHLILELFSKGNIVLTDGEYNILGVLEQQQWKDRTVKPGLAYVFPFQAVDWRGILRPHLAQLLSSSTKRNIVTSLAIDLGLGGVYAEEVCLMANVDKNKATFGISDEEITRLHTAIQELLHLIETPQGYFYEDNITPFALHGKTFLTKTVTYNEALNSVNPFQQQSPYEQKIQALEQTIVRQEEAIGQHEEKIQGNTLKGQYIYEHYQEVAVLLQSVKELREHLGWQEMAEELKRDLHVKKIDLEHKRIQIDL